MNVSLRCSRQRGAIDGASSAGTAFNESHIPEHKCYVLGQLLDTADLVAPLAIEY